MMTASCRPANGTPATAGDPATAADLNPVHVHAAPSGEALALVKEGRPMATVYVAFNPDATGFLADRLSEAVDQLVTCIEKATGARLPVVYEKPEGRMLVVGGCETALAAGVDVSAMPVEGFAIKSFEGGIVLAGRDEVVNTARTTNKDAQKMISAGTAWAVYEFLERFAGVRWYWHGDVGTSIPKRKDLVIKPVHLTDAPVFRKRSFGPDPIYMLRNVSSWPVQVRVHYSASYVASYKENRLAIYELKEDGTRHVKPGPLPIGQVGQKLCYSNPLTLETYIEAIDRAYATGELPGILSYRLPDDFAITVSPTDEAVDCHCELCRANWNKGGGSPASYIVADFVARLAREAKTRWPGKKIIYLPYSNYSRPPEGVEFPDNVEVEVCCMPGLALYKEPFIAEREQKMIDTWYRLTGRKISTWQYICWPQDQTKAAYLFPHVIQDFYRRNKDKIIGSFINGVPYMNHMRRQHLSLYIWSKVLWNPEFPVDAAIDAYCRRMFGPAAPVMRELVQMQIDGWEKNRGLEGEFNEENMYMLSLESVYNTCYPPDSVAAMRELLGRAWKIAGGDPLAIERLAYVTPPLEDFFAESIYVPITGAQVQANRMVNEFLQTLNEQEEKKLPSEKALETALQRQRHKWLRQSRDSGAKDRAALEKCLDLVTGRVTAIPRTAKSPEIDGALAPGEWDKAGRMDDFALRMGLEPIDKRYGTTADLCYDDRYLYLAFTCREQDLDKLITEYKERDGAIWRDDALEIFIMPSPGIDTYYQFCVNSAGYLWDGAAPGFECDGKWNSDAQVAAALDEDTGQWKVEMAIPWKDLGHRPRSGDVMRGNVYRGDKYKSLVPAITTSWAPCFTSHNQNALGILLLE